MMRSYQERKNRFRKSSFNKEQLYDLTKLDETNGIIDSVRVCSPQNAHDISNKVIKKTPEIENFPGEGAIYSDG